MTNRSLTKASLAEILSEKIGFNKSEAKKIVEVFFEEIRQTLENGESVKLAGFGNFELRRKRERPGRNPKTLEQVLVQARRIVTFHASHKLKALVNDGSQKGSNGGSSG